MQRNNTYTYESRRRLTRAPTRKSERRRAARVRALPLDAPERRRLPPLLRRAWYSLNQAFRRRIAHLGMTPDQFTALRTLLEGDPLGLTQSELTQRMSSDPNTVASLVERMEQAGWIERRPHESDRRAHRLRLRSEGERLYAAAREVALSLQTQVLSVLPADEREKFLAHLHVIADACRQAAEDSPKRGRSAGVATEPTVRPSRRLTTVARCVSR